MQTRQIGPQTFKSPVLPRIRLWNGLLLFIFGVFVIRLFYLQVIRHDHYQKAALRSQLKQYTIPAERGTILAHNGNNLTPLVLNEARYTIVADPATFTDSATTSDPPKVAATLQSLIGGSTGDIEKQLKTPKSRYVVLAKRVDKTTKEKIVKLKLKGVFSEEVPQRIYPQGTLAAQLLGFVDGEGIGKYGLEQSLQAQLTGRPGKLKAITDAQGIPLASNRDNIEIAPQAGKQVVLTVDLGMQQQVEDILKAGLESAHSASGSALVMEVNSGAIKAMANYPTYNPSEFYKVTDGQVFNNAAASSPLEVGSIMKVLTAAAALDQGVVNKNTTYYDPSRYKVDDYTITNIEEDGGAGIRSVADILQLSLNTGATWLLMQMGGGQINQKGRGAWHDYMVNHYGLGQLTGIEQGYEDAGSIPDPNKGYGLNIQYANTAFGQGMTATPLQMGAALSSVLNGGIYYRPHVVEGYINVSGKEDKQAPTIVRRNVVKPSVSKEMTDLMEYVVEKNYQLYKLAKPRPEFSIGGKTGTAQITKPGGGYYENRFNGTFLGFVGGDTAQYVIVVRVNDPKISGYAGAGAAAPIFSKISTTLIDNFGVTPKS